MEKTRRDGVLRRGRQEHAEVGQVAQHICIEFHGRQLDELADASLIATICYVVSSHTRYITSRPPTHVCVGVGF